MGADMQYLRARLGEHSTQVLLSADFTALLAAGSGKIGWATFLVTLVGSLPGILIPATTQGAAP